MLVKLDDFTVVLLCGPTEFYIDRAKLKLCQRTREFSPKTEFRFELLLGAFEINSKTYLAFATNVSNVTTFWNIEYVVQIRIIQLSVGSRDHDAEYILTRGLNLTRLYFSRSHDLSLTVAMATEKSASRSQFVWNSCALDNLGRISSGLRDMATPLLVGFVGECGTLDLPLYVISRRSCMRAGTRFWTRGSDLEGNTANCVETEQILVAGDDVFSHVQLRGSIPIVWSQTPDLTAAPPFDIEDEKKCEVVCRAHLLRAVRDYERICIVGLTNKHGRETVLAKLFSDVAEVIPGVSYMYFDFHGERRSTKCCSVKSMISPTLVDFGYTQVTNGECVKRQTGVIRTNCVNSLDRTNTVQFWIGEDILRIQTADHDLSFTDYKGLCAEWCENGNTIACQYAGSDAYLFTEPVTIIDAWNKRLHDGRVWATRWYNNVFVDDARQDAYDVVTQSLPCQCYSTGPSQIPRVLLAVYTWFVCLFIVRIFGEKRKRAYIEKMKPRIINRPRFRLLSKDPPDHLSRDV